MRGTSLPTEGPGLSARRICRVKPSFLPDSGTIAIRNTSTPMPPTQWLKLRQYRMPRDRLSTSGRILEPVVVKPDTISNSASINDGIPPEIQNGRQPRIDITIQVSPVSTRPSRA